MPSSINGTVKLIISKCLFLLLLVFISISSISSLSQFSQSGDPSDSGYLQIPDHQGVINKLYYYRLPISPVKFQQIKHLTIKEVDRNGLPEWLMLRREKDRWELIGFPQDQDKGIHFFQIEIQNKDDTKIADVFTIEITHVLPSLFSSSISTNPIGKKENCIIQLITTFNSILDVWKIIAYFIPSKLRQEINLSAKLIEFTNNLEEIDDPNILMTQWSQRLFSITQKEEKDGTRKYQLTIENQECSEDKAQLSNDGYNWKLKKLGLEFRFIRVIKSPLQSDGSLFEDVSASPLDELNPSRAYLKSLVPVSINYDNSQRRHARRHLPDIKPTPSIYPDFMTISTSLIYPNLDENNEIEPSQLSRIVPSLTSPSAFPPSSNIPGSPSVTPRMPDNYGVGGNDHSHFHPILYTTPTPSAEPPSVFIEGLSTPTPILPSSKIPDLSSSALIPDLAASSVDLISPTPTFGLGVSTVRVDEPIIFEGTDKTSGEKTSEPSRPEITANSRPELRARIPKLAPTAGFYRVSSSMKERVHPPKDFWIQFDAENQVLTAFPTDDDVGVYENQFYLEAVDSGGLSNVENITIHVRQHTSYRKFPYNITFYRVYWDPLRITTTIEALRTFAQIVSQLNGDYDIDSFIVQHLTKESIDGRDYWTIVSTNDSIPAYPCPTKKIQQLYNRLADKQSKGQYALPSESLISKMNKMFTIDGVGLSISCSKPNTAAEKPELRNPIEVLRFHLGEVFRYKIAENMFYSGRGRNTYNLELSLYDGFGRIPPQDGFVKFNEKTFEIIGLADDRKYIRENEFNLVARDRESENDASDAFVIVIDDPWNEDEISFTVTIGLSINEKMGIDDKLDIAHRIATSIFNDSDTSSLRILKIIKRNYTFMQSGYYTGTETKNPDLSDIDEDENVIERRKRSDPYDNSIEEGSIHQMYEYVWTNKTEPLLAKGGECPSTDIQTHILHKLFKPDTTFETWDEKFADKYRIMSIEFKPVGKCSNYMTSREVYRDNVKPNIIPERDITHETVDNVNYGQPTSKDYDVHTNELDDYYLRTIIPAIATVAVLLVVLCVIVCILVKCRRDIDKNRFDMTIRPGIDGYPTEVDAFIQKGRRPVILQSDYQQNLPMNTMMVTYNPTRQQTYSMANINKSSYHALAHAVEQRRQPPPYR
uniref:Peptidase S72 domain-containing protein n=1 Tax=Tetranychus urticae TaxID=32264 RepID=T1KAE7_TETUR